MTSSSIFDNLAGRTFGVRSQVDIVPALVPQLLPVSSQRTMSDEKREKRKPKFTQSARGSAHGISDANLPWVEPVAKPKDSVDERRRNEKSDEVSSSPKSNLRNEPVNINTPSIDVLGAPPKREQESASVESNDAVATKKEQKVLSSLSAPDKTADARRDTTAHLEPANTTSKEDHNTYAVADKAPLDDDIDGNRTTSAMRKDENEPIADITSAAEQHKPLVDKRAESRLSRVVPERIDELQKNSSLLVGQGEDGTHRDASTRRSTYTQAAPEEGAAATTTMQDDNNVVTINIGRIDVRAVFPRTTQSPPSKQQPNTISLADYLKMRAEGRI